MFDMETKAQTSGKPEPDVNPPDSPRRMNFLQRFIGRTNLMVKLIVPFGLLTLLPIFLIALYSYSATRTALTNAADLALLSSAQQTAAGIKVLMEGMSDNFAAEALHPNLVAYLGLSSDRRRGSQEEQLALRRLNLFLIGKEDILSYSLLDAAGGVWASTLVSPEAIDQLPPNLGMDLLDRGYINKSFASESAFISPLSFYGDAKVPCYYFVAKISNNLGDRIGLLVVQVHARILQKEIEKYNNLAGADSFSVLYDENLMRLAHGMDPNALYRMASPVSDQKLDNLQQAGRLPEISRDLLVSDSTSLAQGFQELKSNPVFTSAEEGISEGLGAIAGVRLEDYNWIVAFIQPEAAFLQPVVTATRILVLLAIIIISLTGLLAFFMAQGIIRPISQLTNVAAKVSQGNLNLRSPVNTQDEIGILSTAFNEMTDQLQQMMVGLESRVQERTQELEQTNEQMSLRASRFQAVAEVSRALAGVQNLDELLPLITRIISERFGFYHVGIFLVDPNREFAVLRAANSQGGQLMLARSHRLRVGQEGLVGFATGRGLPRIALDVGEDAVFFTNPELPYTRSEVALPLVAGGQVIGALDVQSEQPAAFAEGDILFLTTLADLVAVAIENARIFSETRQALITAQAAQRGIVGEQWERLAKHAEQSGYQYLYGQVDPIRHTAEDNIWTLLEEQGQLLLSTDNEDSLKGKDANELYVPVSLRGEVIGMLRLQDLEKGRSWEEEEISLVKAVADQVGLALENARLLEETQLRADREHLVGQITTRLRASNDPQTILQTAVSELKQALRAQKAQIIFQSDSLEFQGQEE
jgi:GAF domain-containing protein/HAMP domain-containing protein